MRIGIWHWTNHPFDGERLRAQAYGGTETAIVHTAEALVRLGCRVDVLTNAEREKSVAGVRYLPAKPLRRALHGESYDAFLIVRHLAALGVPVRTRSLAYWSHDNCDQPFLHGMLRARGSGAWGDLGQLSGHLDAVLCVSQWQRASICETFDLAPECAHVIGNGLQPGLYEELPTQRKHPILVHSLPPERALMDLASIFARVRERAPRAQLHAFSSRTLYGLTAEEDERMFGPIYDLLRRFPGARLQPPVDQRTLAASLARARVYAYPGRTPETFSISLLEAQAAGAVPIASPLGAIPERIEDGVDGFLVPGDPSTDAYQEEFSERTIELLAGGELQQRMSRQARERALSSEYSYTSVAERLVAALDATVERNPVRERCLRPGEPELFNPEFPGEPLAVPVQAELQRAYEQLLHLA